MSVINCEINLILSWCEHCVLISGTIDGQVPMLGITLCSIGNFIGPTKYKTVK